MVELVIRVLLPTSTKKNTALTTLKEDNDSNNNVSIFWNARGE
jgi:hypothetical protein